MLAKKGSAGVAPEVNLRDPAGNKAHRQEIYAGFETQSRHHHKCKTGVSVGPQKGLMPSKKSLKTKRKIRRH